jgi:NADPH2:quinone reductase
MKAIVSATAGDESTLQLADIPDPVAGPGQVLIRVHACGVNYLDTLIIADKYQVRPPRPFIPGAEIAGTVIAVGEGVTSIHPHERVVAWHLFGGMAEKAVVHADSCMSIPDSMPFDVAASLVLAYGTSLHALLERACLRPGEVMLVLGAAGGVGLAAVEVGKAFGATVIASCSTEAKTAIARRHGADAGIVYPSGMLNKDLLRDFTNAIRQSAPNGVNVIYDPVGAELAEASIRAIAWDGRYVVVGFAGGIPKLPLNLLLLNNCAAIGVYWGGVMERDPSAYQRYASELIRLYETGAINPQISERFPLANTAQAFRALSSRTAVGKVVVTIR